MLSTILQSSRPMPKELFNRSTSGSRNTGLSNSLKTFHTNNMGDTLKFGLVSASPSMLLSPDAAGMTASTILVPDDMLEVIAAKALASWMHEGQIRRLSGAPFEIHPDNTLNNLMLFVDKPTLLEIYGTALHDGIEDCGVTTKENRYGKAKEMGWIPPELDALIQAVSQEPHGSKFEKKATFVSKMSQNFRAAAKAIEAHSDGRINEKEARQAIIAVVASDKLDGMRAIMNELDSNQRGPNKRVSLQENPFTQTSSSNLRRRPFIVDYYYALTYLMWKNWRTIGSPERLKPLMLILAQTTESFAKKIALVSAHGANDREVYRRLQEEKLTNPLIAVAVPV